MLESKSRTGTRLKPRANRRKIVGQQLPTLLDVTCCDRLHTLLHVVARSLKAVKLFSQQLPTFLLFRDRRSVAPQCWIHLHNSSFTGEKCLRKRHDKDHMVDFRQSHWLRGKIPAKHCQDERKNGRFFLSVVVLWFCCHCESSKIILVEIFSDMCCLVDNASWNCQTNTLARYIYPRSALQSFDARRGHAKKVGNFLLLCLVQVSCNSVQQEII